MLRSREKIVLVAGAVAAAVILLATFVVIPGISRLRSLSRASSIAERDLAELRTLRPELERMDREVRQKAGRVTASANVTDSPHARLTALAQEAGLPQAAISLKSGGQRNGEFYNEEAFDLKVENVTYLEAVRLLGKLENGQLPVAIRSVLLKSRYDDSNYLDATLRIGFLKPVAR